MLISPYERTKTGLVWIELSVTALLLCTYIMENDKQNKQVFTLLDVM